MHGLPRTRSSPPGWGARGGAPAAPLNVTFVMGMPQRVERSEAQGVSGDNWRARLQGDPRQLKLAEYVPHASPGDFCFGKLSVFTSSPTHLVTSSSDIDEPSSRHARTAPSFVMTKRIFTSPCVDGSRFSPALKHACTFP